MHTLLYFFVNDFLLFFFYTSCISLPICIKLVHKHPVSWLSQPDEHSRPEKLSYRIARSYVPQIYLPDKKHHEHKYVRTYPHAHISIIYLNLLDIGLTLIEAVEEIGPTNEQHDDDDDKFSEMHMTEIFADDFLSAINKQMMMTPWILCRCIRINFPRNLNQGLPCHCRSRP